MSEVFTAFRIVKTKWEATAFDGEGARLYGGRWNSKGLPCVYLAGSESLAALEMLVHLNSDSIRSAYSTFKVQIPADQVLTVSDADLPENWRDNPAPTETASFGDTWLRSGESAALLIPSVIMPREQNVLLNPKHPDFNRIVESQTKLAFEFDTRLK